MTDENDGPVFQVEPKGRLGNRMIQYMVALKFQRLVPGSRIANVMLPEWDIYHPAIHSPGPVAFVSQQQHFDMAGLTERARAGEIRRVVFAGYGQRMENFLDADVYRTVFRRPDVQPARFDEQHLICPVRAEDVLDKRYVHYPLTPVEFYADIVEATGLTPVFMGQTAPNLYTNRLRERFPHARFLKPGDPISDFETIRHAKNIVLGVTTFAWLAAWLSHAEQIFMAVSGLFNPMHKREVDLLPFGDSRYRFYLFPINQSVPLADHAAAHQRIAPLWRQLPHDVLRRQFQEAPRFDPSIEEMHAAFDPEYYLATNAEVADMVGADNAEAAWAHYQSRGIQEERLPFRLSPGWYAARYPMAALEIAQGDYSSFAHHYIAEGRARGYRPMPDGGDRRRRMTDVADGPIFHVEPRGWLASRMIQYMVALTFQSLVPGSRISNVQLPEWGIDYPPLELPEPIESASQPQHVEMAGLAERARAGEVRSIVYSGYGQRLENFLDVDVYRSAFCPPVVSPLRFGEQYLVCHVRTREITYGTEDPNAPLTPVEFYADIVAETGLIPVFVGQTAPNRYTDRLRKRFPRAEFLDTGDTIVDFETIRQAKNIAIGVSTYAWLAAWLSRADRIFMAVSGRFNPMQNRLTDLLPFGDPRYHFYLFPVNYVVPLQRHAAYHERIAPLWRLVPHDLLQRFFREAPRFDPPVEQMLEEFDAKYYLQANPDVAEIFGPDNAEGARHHYRESGVRELRLPFKLSPTWYAERYPMAALEISQGDYSSFAHHYVAVGRARGYRPLPDASDSRIWGHAISDDPVTAPSIAVLAKEVLWLERAEVLGAETEVSLGESFDKLLPPDIAESFTRRKTAEPVRIYRLRDVLLDVSMMALFNGRQPIRETLYMMNEWDYEYARVKPLYPEPTNATLHYIVGCNASVGNYFHWMTQSLPAIDWGLRSRRHPNVALALPPLQPWQVEALGLLGHANVARLTLRPSAHYALASAEYAEFLGERMDRLVSRAAAATYARLRQAVAPAVDGGSEIYVARTDVTRRAVVNEAELIAMLEGQGVRIVVPGTLSVTQQIAIFRRARLVIGPHGAGLSNIIGCEPGTHFYELLPSHYPNYCYNRLAQSCRLHYWGDAFPGEAGEGDPHDRNWRIDLDVVAARLQEIRARIAATEYAADER